MGDNFGVNKILDYIFHCFYIVFDLKNDGGVHASLEGGLLRQNVPLEEVISIVYQPEAISKVCPIIRCMAMILVTKN